MIERYCHCLNISFKLADGLEEVADEELPLSLRDYGTQHSIRFLAGELLGDADVRVSRLLRTVHLADTTVTYCRGCNSVAIALLFQMETGEWSVLIPDDLLDGDVVPKLMQEATFSPTLQLRLRDPIGAAEPVVPSPPITDGVSEHQGELPETQEQREDIVPRRVQLDQEELTKLKSKAIERAKRRTNHEINKFIAEQRKQLAEKQAAIETSYTQLLSQLKLTHKRYKTHLEELLGTESQPDGGVRELPICVKLVDDFDSSEDEDECPFATTQPVQRLRANTMPIRGRGFKSELQLLASESPRSSQDKELLSDSLAFASSFDVFPFDEEVSAPLSPKVVSTTTKSGFTAEKHTEMYPMSFGSRVTGPGNFLTAPM